MVKNPPAKAGDARDAGLILGREDPLEKEMAPHFRTIQYKIDTTGLKVIRAQITWASWTVSSRYFRCIASKLPYWEVLNLTDLGLGC